MHALLLLAAIAVGWRSASGRLRQGRRLAAVGGHRPRRRGPARLPRSPTRCRNEVTSVTPYVTTLLVLALASQRPATAHGRRPALPPRRGTVTRLRGGRGRLGRAAGRPRSRRWGAPTRRTRSSRSARPPWSTTAGSSPAATSRTPPTGSACAPSAAWSRRCTRTGGGRLVAVACVDGDGQLADAVRPLPAAAVGARRPDCWWRPPRASCRCASCCRDAFGPDDLDRRLTAAPTGPVRPDGV